MLVAWQWWHVTKIYVQYLKKKIPHLENELIKKDTTIEYWSNQITSSSNNEPHSVDENSAFNESVKISINSETI